MPLILTSAPRATRGLPALPSDMEHVLSMKLRLTTEEVNILWSALGDRLVDDFTTSHSSDKLDVDRELSITGPSFHLGKLGILLQAENSMMLKLIVGRSDSVLGAEIVAPPVRQCVVPGCPQLYKPLGGNRAYFQGTAYTHRRGVLKIQILTLSCRGACSMRDIHRCSKD